MKSVTTLAVVCALVAGVASVFSQQLAEMGIFDKVDVTDPSNAVSAINEGTHVGEFLGGLFEMSFSDDPAGQRFGGSNIADISAGSLVYAEEFGMHRSDWDSLVDAFLIKGVLTASDEAKRKGFEILLWQRTTPTVKAFIEKIKLQRPDVMQNASN